MMRLTQCPSAVPNYTITDTLTSAAAPASARELYYFADVCAGPGGFCEYLLWRRLYSCHGFGITLRGRQDED